jgi:2,5-dioxopentanoate dehydrogenase
MSTAVTGGMYIAGEAVFGDGQEFRAVDPATGTVLEPAFRFAGSKLAARAAELAEAAFESFRSASAQQRARLLELAADEIDAVGAEAAQRAHLETGLPLPRLTGEVARTTGQLRLFAATLREGSWNGARIDHELPDRAPARRPDVRQRRVPVGPVVVFAASNFPLAFSVAGGDTASALAAGCPVIVKAHEAHPGTSEIVAAAVTRAVAASGLPAGVFSMVLADGPTVGIELVTHPAIAAVGFTGSRRVGLSLVAAAARRPVPIPVYAEMSAVNPVFLLPERLSEAAAELGTAFVGSLTLGAGQFCTNPGIIVAVDGPDLDRFAAAAGGAVAASSPAPMLTGNIAANYASGVARLTAHQGVEVIARGEAPGTPEAPGTAETPKTSGTSETPKAPGTAETSKTSRTSGTPETSGTPGASGSGHASTGSAALVSTTADEFLASPDLQNEVFGASSVVVRAASTEQLLDVARAMEGQLTATVHASDADAPLASGLLPVLERLAGRIIFNGWPTGVEVVPSMVHGGPFPATSDGRTTSVGTNAMDRFLRPVAYQDVPDALLPTAVREANPDGLLRLVDGSYTRD